MGEFRGKPSRNRVLTLRQNGIRRRHYALDENGKWSDTLAGMTAKAAVACFERYDDAPDFLVSTGTLGDHLVPGLGSQVHAETGWPEMEVASLQSVCASSMHGLKHATMALALGYNRLAVVTGGEFASRYLTAAQYECQPRLCELNQLPLELDFLRFTLSDGASAVKLETTPDHSRLNFKVLDFRLKSFANRFPVCMSGGAANVGAGTNWRPWSNFPNAVEAAKAGAFNLQQAFHLLDPMLETWTQHFLEEINAGWIAIDAVDVVLSHASTKNLNDKGWNFLRKAGAMIPEEKWFSNLREIGNIGSASPFALLTDYLASDRAEPGQRVLLHVPESGRCQNAFVKLQIV